MSEQQATRRAILAGASGIAAAAALAAVPARAGAAINSTALMREHHSTPIQRLWSEYCAFKPEWERICEAVTRENEAATYTPATERLCDLQHEILEATPETISDLLVQADMAEERDYQFVDDTEDLVRAIRAFAETQAKGGANV
jgi:hypothetical protein